jgi:hypothetical protein
LFLRRCVAVAGGGSSFVSASRLALVRKSHFTTGQPA